MFGWMDGGLNTNQIWWLQSLLSSRRVNDLLVIQMDDEYLNVGGMSYGAWLYDSIVGCCRFVSWP